jgi:F-type H+-transporting ATPase subunit epsilon
MLKLEIVTPEKKVFEGSVESVTVPTANGEIGIFPNHAPLISSLKPGILTVVEKTGAEKMVVAGGFVEVNSNTVSVIADIAESSEEIDVNAAKESRDEAVKTLGSWSGGAADEFEAVSDRLAEAQAKLQLAGSR